MFKGGSPSSTTTSRARRSVLFLAALSVLLAVVPGGCDSDSISTPFADRGFTGEVQDQAHDWRLELKSDSTLAVGSLIIPKIGVHVDVVEGVEEGDLKQGPGHWPETPLPGQNGRVVISGHRSTFGAPFLRLDELSRGDLIEFVLPYGTAIYAVTALEMVGPQDTDHVRQRGVEELSLTTCHPVMSDRFRLLVHAEALLFLAAP
jgi:LPXTG-site transpeptidase (sortase) family protein